MSFVEKEYAIIEAGRGEQKSLPNVFVVEFGILATQFVAIRIDRNSFHHAADG